MQARACGLAEPGLYPEPPNSGKPLARAEPFPVGHQARVETVRCRGMVAMGIRELAIETAGIFEKPASAGFY